MNSSRLKPLNRRLSLSQRQVRKERQEIRHLNAGRCVKCGAYIPPSDRNYCPNGTWCAT